MIERRDFLRLCGAGALALVLPGDSRSAAAGKPLRGIFPIAQTPFTSAGALDVDALAEQVRFLDRGGVHGCVWPQLASEWATLKREERQAGAEAITATGKKLKPAIVIGVQAEDAEAAVRYARHAEKAGADAVIALPPPKQSDPKVLLDYYRRIGAATPLPLFAQAVGSMSVDLLVELWQTVPTLRYVKDEAGQPLLRIAPLRERTKGELKIFTGGHGKTLIDEMRRGFEGTMPAASFADLYAGAWDRWHAGQTAEAMEIFARAAVLINEISAFGLESMKYILVQRGVFKTYSVREAQHDHLDEEGKKVLRELLDFARPYLKA